MRKRTMGLAVLLSLSAVLEAGVARTGGLRRVSLQDPGSGILRLEAGEAIAFDGERSARLTPGALRIFDRSGDALVRIPGSGIATMSFGRRAPGTISVFGGPAPRGWLEAASRHRSVVARRFLPGTDLAIDGRTRAPEIVARLRSVEQLDALRIVATGSTLSIGSDGELVIEGNEERTAIAAPAVEGDPAARAQWQVVRGSIATLSVSGLDHGDGLSLRLPLLSGASADALAGITFNDLAADGHGSIVASGTYSGPPLTLLTLLRPRDPYAGAVARFDRSGSLSSLVFITGREEVRTSALALSPDGGAVVVGETLDPLLPQRLPGLRAARLLGVQDAFAASLSPDGHLRWADVFGAPGLDEAVDVAVAPDGTVAIVGETHDAGLYPIHRPVFVGVITGASGFLVRRAPDGRVLDSSTFGNAAVTVRSVDAADDAFVIAGDTVRPDQLRQEGVVYGVPDRYRGSREPIGDAFAYVVPVHAGDVRSTSFIGGSGSQAAPVTVARDGKLVLAMRNGIATIDGEADDLRAQPLDSTEPRWVAEFEQGVTPDEGTDQIDHEQRNFYGSRLTGREYPSDVAVADDGSIHLLTSPQAPGGFNISQIGLRRYRSDGTVHSWFGFERLAGNRRSLEVSYPRLAGVATEGTASLVLLHDRDAWQLVTVPM